LGRINNTKRMMVNKIFEKGPWDTIGDLILSATGLPNNSINNLLSHHLDACIYKGNKTLTKLGLESVSASDFSEKNIRKNQENETESTNIDSFSERMVMDVEISDIEQYVGEPELTYQEEEVASPPEQKLNNRKLGGYINIWDSNFEDSYSNYEKPQRLSPSIKATSKSLSNALRNSQGLVNKYKEKMVQNNDNTNRLNEIKLKKYVHKKDTNNKWYHFPYTEDIVSEVRSLTSKGNKKTEIKVIEEKSFDQLIAEQEIASIESEGKEFISTEPMEYREYKPSKLSSLNDLNNTTQNIEYGTFYKTTDGTEFRGDGAYDKAKSYQINKDEVVRIRRKLIDAISIPKNCLEGFNRITTELEERSEETSANIDNEQKGRNSIMKKEECANEE
jgi:hypothetical protein